MTVIKLNNRPVTENRDLELDILLKDYREWCNLFFTQMYDLNLLNDPALSATDLDYYIELWNSRVFSLSTWFEHTTNREFPENWREYSDFRFQRQPA